MSAGVPAEAPAPGGRLLELRGVSRHFGGVAAVDGVDLTVPDGELLGLIGPNGAGKTTLLDIVSGLQTATGTITFRDNDVTRWPAHRRATRGLARTFQTSRLFGPLTALENVLVGLHAHRRDDTVGRLLLLPGPRRDLRRRRARARELLERVGLDARGDDRADRLTPEDRRRLELARALALEPALLLLDEPAAGMGPAEVQALGRLVRELNADGLSMVLVEHHVGLVVEVCTRVVVLDFGRTIAEGPPAEVVAMPAVREAYLGRR